MVSIDTPVVARRRVRLVLRRTREARKLTQTQVAEAMEWSLSKVMRIESGEVTIMPNDLRPLLAYLGIVDKEQVDMLLQAAKLSRQRAGGRTEWWDEAPFKDAMTPPMRQLVRYETEATAIRYFYALVVPGQLQIPEYAAAIMENYRSEATDASVEMTDEMATLRVQARERRHRQLLERADPPKIYALLDESVLQRRIGGSGVLGNQLSELLRLINEDRLMVRIVPFDLPAPIPMLGTYEILYLGDDTADDAEEYAIMYRESDLVDEIVEDVEKIRRHRGIFERLWHAAPDEIASTKMLEERVKSLLQGGA